MNKLKSFMCSKHCTHFFLMKIKVQVLTIILLLFGAYNFCCYFCSLTVCVHMRECVLFIHSSSAHVCCVALLICFVFTIINIRRYQVPLCCLFAFSKSITMVAISDIMIHLRTPFACAQFFLLISHKM